MLHALFIAALISAPHVSPNVLNGIWVGHLNAQNTENGCPIDECTFPRDATYVFEGGQLRWDKDLQMLDLSENDWFDMKTHGRVVHPERVLQTHFSYSFKAANGALYHILTTSYSNTLTQGAVVQGCTCVYTGTLQRAE